MKGRLQAARAHDSLRRHAILPAAIPAPQQRTPAPSAPSAIKPPVSDEHTIQRIRALRSRGLSPNQIARNLGIRTSVVSDTIRELAAERAAISPEADQIDCLLNAGWSTGLTIDGHAEWHDPHADETTGGLVTALVARRRRHRRGATICVYLLDVYCRGVKNAIGPRNRRRPGAPPPHRPRLQRIPGTTRHHADRTRARPRLRRRRLRAAARVRTPPRLPARAHLGPWTGPSAITFGHNGKPTYISGPYDDSQHIIRTLRRAVGRNGFSYTASVDLNQLPLTG